MKNKDIEVRHENGSIEVFIDILSACIAIAKLKHQERPKVELWDCSGGTEFKMFRGDYKNLHGFIRAIS